MSNNKYQIDINSLDNIDCEEKAYFLGFLFADGHNSNRNQIIINIQGRDGYILERFLNILKSNHPIKTKTVNGREYKGFSITNKYLSDKLRKYNIDSNKTYNASFPKYIRDDLIRHFIRGFMDGDGSIDFKNPRVQFVGTFNMMKDLELIVESLTGVKGNIREESRSEKIYYYSIYGGNKCEKFLDYIYDDSHIYLDRKFEKYTSLKGRNKDGWKTRVSRYGRTGSSKKPIHNEIIEYIISDDKEEYNKFDLLSMFIDKSKLSKENIFHHINKLIKNNNPNISISNGYGKIKVIRY